MTLPIATTMVDPDFSHYKPFVPPILRHRLLPVHHTVYKLLPPLHNLVSAVAVGLLIVVEKNPQFCDSHCHLINREEGRLTHCYNIDDFCFVAVVDHVVESILDVVVVEFIAMSQPSLWQMLGYYYCGFGSTISIGNCCLVWSEYS